MHSFCAVVNVLTLNKFGRSPATFAFGVGMYVLTASKHRHLAKSYGHSYRGSCPKLFYASQVKFHLRTRVKNLDATLEI